MNSRVVLSVGIIFRLMVYLFASRNYATEYFYPFLGSLNLSVDPWEDWLQANGRVDAFPYGMTLLIVLKILIEIEMVIRGLLPFLPRGLMLFLFLLIIDLLVYLMIRKRGGSATASIYALSPIAIYVSYFYLQTDAVVGIFLLLSAIRLTESKVKISGLFLGCAIGCKFGVLLVVPFMLAFAFVNIRFRASILRVLVYAAPIAFLNYIPAIWSESFRKMVLGTSEANQMYAMKLMLGDVTFLVFPAIYVLLIIWIWRSGRSNLKVLTGFIGTALFTLSLTSSAGVGWHLWGLSLLILLSDWQKLEIQLIFVLLQVLVLVRDITSGNASEFGLGFENQLILNIAFTFSAVLGFSWALSNLAKLVNKSDILKLNRRPLLVAIAGNSGVGKDTFADSLSAVFGEKNVSFLSGDGYHKYERGNGRWQAKTHLNPEQNRLAEWKIDIDNVLNRKPILKSEYDHSIGRFTPQLILKPKDFVISQGLHALDSEISKYADLKVFMEMDEETRLQVKVLRDTSKRGRSLQSIRSEMHKRRKDYRDYILPQRDLANIVIKQIGKVRAEKVEISTLMLEIRDIKFVDLLAKAFLPHFPNLQLKINGNESGQIHFNSIATMSSETIYVILKTNLESFGELSIKREQLKSGALGIATAASLLYLENRRRQVGK